MNIRHKHSAHRNGGKQQQQQQKIKPFLIKYLTAIIKIIGMFWQVNVFTVEWWYL